MKMMSDQVIWAPKPAWLALEKDEVHVWCAVLDKPAASIQSLLPSLSSEEVKRAEGFHCSKDRSRFIASHGALRTILGLYLDISPEKIGFRSNSFGKPLVDVSTSKGNIQFNISHSHDVALLAIARSRQVGIDVEYVQPFAEMDQLISRFFTSREQQALRSVSGDHKLQTFLRYWTYKEANMKARGAGLSISLEQLDAFDSAVNVSALSDIRKDHRGISQWHTIELTPPFPDYVATLTVEENSAYRLSCWQWPD